MYQVGNAAFEFIIRPYKDTKVTFESRKFLKSFLAVDQNAHISVQEMPPDSSEVQFVVRVQVSIHQPTFFLKVHTAEKKCSVFLKLRQDKIAMYTIMSFYVF